MREMEEAVWRAALAVRGKDWVARELKTRPGMPGDPVLEVVFAEPLPSREFCGRWCAEQENRLVVFSGGMIVGIALVLIIAASATMGILAFEKPPYYPPSNLAGGPAALGRAINQDENAVSSPNRGSTPSVSKSRSSCAYTTYQTAECRTSRY